MSDPLTRKLELFGPLSNDDKKLLAEATARPRSVHARQDLVHEGDAPGLIQLVTTGLACRYAILPDGKRSIVAYLVPGDTTDLHAPILGKTDHAVAALSPCTVVDLTRRRALELLGRPAIARALWSASLVDAATLRAWLVNMGRRDALTRIAHLLCELHARLAAVGLATAGEFDLPVTQADLGDTVGLSTVHVNRCVLWLEADRLASFRRGRVSILDVGRLRGLCRFDPAYLHLGSGDPGPGPSGRDGRGDRGDGGDEP